MNKFLTNVRKTVCDPRAIATFAMCFVCCFGFAQEGSQVINAASNALGSLVQDVVKLLRIILGLGALVTLVMVIFKLFKGDREAAEKIGWWVAGLTLGFLLLTVVSNLIQTS